MTYGLLAEPAGRVSTYETRFIFSSDVTHFPRILARRRTPSKHIASRRPFPLFVVSCLLGRLCFGSRGSIQHLDDLGVLLSLLLEDKLSLLVVDLVLPSATTV